jgi:hypothetical protein
MKAKQLLTYVIRPVLGRMKCGGSSAENLLLLTAAQESGMGEYIHQLGGGPALGIYQMEPRSEQSVLQWLEIQVPHIHDTVIGYYHLDGVDGQACGNLYYATALARAFYLRFPEKLPDADDAEGLARYYKLYYNTPRGAATVAGALSSYRTYVGERT